MSKTIQLYLSQRVIRKQLTHCITTSENCIAHHQQQTPPLHIYTPATDDHQTNSNTIIIHHSHTCAYTHTLSSTSLPESLISWEASCYYVELQSVGSKQLFYPRWDEPVTALTEVGYGTWGLSFFVLFKAPPHLLLKDNIEVQYSPL